MSRRRRVDPAPQLRRVAMVAAASPRSAALNLLHEAHWYDESDIPTGEAFAALAVPAFVVA